MDSNVYKYGMPMGYNVPGMSMEYNVPGMGIEYKSPPLPTLHKPPTENCAPFQPQSMNMSPTYYAGEIPTSGHPNVKFSPPLPHSKLVSSPHVVPMNFPLPPPPQFSAGNCMGMYGSPALPLPPLDQGNSFLKHPWSCAFTTVLSPGFASSVPSHSHVSSPIPPSQRVLSELPSHSFVSSQIPPPQIATREQPHNSYNANKGMTEPAKSWESSSTIVQAAKNHGIMMKYTYPLVNPHSKSESTFKSSDACLAIPKCGNKTIKIESHQNTESENATDSIQYIEYKIPLATVGESAKTNELVQGEHDDNLDVIEDNEFLSYDYDEDSDNYERYYYSDDYSECNEDVREIKGDRIEINTESTVQKDKEVISVEKNIDIKADEITSMEDINLYGFNRKTIDQCEDGNKDDNNVHDFSSNCKIEKQTCDNIAFDNSLNLDQKLETLNKLQVNQHTASIGMQNDPDDEVIRQLALSIVQKAVAQGILYFKELMNVGVLDKVHDQPTVKNESIETCYDLNIQNVDKYVKDDVAKEHSSDCAVEDFVAWNKLYSWPLISNISNNNFHKENIDNVNDIEQANDMKSKGNKSDVEQLSDMKSLNKTAEFEINNFKQKALQHGIKIVSPEKGLEETTKTLKCGFGNAKVSKNRANIFCPSDCSLREQNMIMKISSQVPCLDKLTRSDVVCNNIGVENFHLNILDHFEMKATQKEINSQDPKVSICNDSVLELKSGKRNLNIGDTSTRTNSMNNPGGMNSNLNPLTPEFNPTRKSEKQNSGLGCVSIDTTGVDFGAKLQLTMTADAPAFVPNLFKLPVKIEANTAEFQQEELKPVNVEANAAKFSLKCLKPDKPHVAMQNHISYHSIGTQSSPTCVHIGVATRKVRMKELAVQTTTCDTRDILVNTIESVDNRNHSGKVDKSHKKSVSVGVNVNSVESLCDNSVFTDDAFETSSANAKVKVDILVKKIQDLQLQLVACKKTEVLKTLDEMRQGLVHHSGCLLSKFTDGSQSIILKNIVQEQIDAIEKARRDIEEVTRLTVVTIGSDNHVDEIPDLTKYIPASLSSSSMTFTGHLMQTEMENVIENDIAHKFPEIKLCSIDVGTMTEYSHLKTSHITLSPSHVTAKTYSPVKQKNESTEIKLYLIDVGTMTEYSQHETSHMTRSSSHVTAERKVVQKNEDVVSDVHIKVAKNEHDQVMFAANNNQEKPVKKSKGLMELDSDSEEESCLEVPANNSDCKNTVASHMAFCFPATAHERSSLNNITCHEKKLHKDSTVFSDIENLKDIPKENTMLSDFTSPSSTHKEGTVLSDFTRLKNVHKEDKTLSDSTSPRKTDRMLSDFKSPRKTDRMLSDSTSPRKTDRMLSDFTSPRKIHKEDTVLSDFARLKNVHKEDKTLSDFLSSKTTHKEDAVLTDFTSLKNVYREDKMLRESLKFKTLLSEKMKAEYSYITADICVDDVKYTEDEDEFRKLEKAEDCDQILNECKKKISKMNRLMEVEEVFDNITDKRNACVSNTDDTQIECWEEKGQQEENAIMNSLPEDQTLDATNGVDYDGATSLGIDTNPMEVYMSPPRESKTLAKDSKKTAVMEVTPTKAVIGVTGNQNMSMVSMPHLDPFLYQAVLAQLIQSYPKLASNQELLSVVAAQQTALLQSFMNTNPTGDSDQPTGMSGLHDAQNLICNNSLQGFMGNMDTDMTKLRSPVMPASTMVSMSGNATYNYALGNHSGSNAAFVETPNTASENSTDISALAKCSSNKKAMEEKFCSDMSEGKRCLSRPPGFKSNITDVPYKDDREQQKTARNSSTLKHNLSAESCHESTSKMCHFVDIGSVNVNSAVVCNILSDLVPGNVTADDAGEGDILYHSLPGNGTTDSAGDKTLNELVTGNVTADCAGETGNRTANSADKYSDDCITGNVTETGAGEGNILCHSLPGSEIVNSAGENLNDHVTRNFIANAAGKCALINARTASCDSPINLTASFKQVELRKSGQAVPDFLPDFVRRHNPEITKNRIVHHFTKALGDQVLRSVSNSATVNFSHRRPVNELASFDKDTLNPLASHSNQTNANNSKSCGLNSADVLSLRPAQASKISHVQVESENWDEEVDEKALEFHRKKSVLFGTSVLKKQPASPTNLFSIPLAKKQGASPISMLGDIPMPKVAKNAVKSSEGKNEVNGWFQNRTASKELTNPKLSVTSRLNTVPSNEMKKSNFEQLIGQVLQQFPCASRQEAIYAVQRVQTLYGSLTGLDMESIIEKACIFIQSKPDNKPSTTDEDICVICHDGLSLMPVKELDCKHRFHKQCISVWVERERTCPTCRRHALFLEDFPKLSK